MKPRTGSPAFPFAEMLRDAASRFGIEWATEALIWPIPQEWERKFWASHEALHEGHRAWVAAGRPS